MSENTTPTPAPETPGDSTATPETQASPASQEAAPVAEAKPAETQAAPEVKKPEKRKVKLKVDDEEKELEFTDEDLPRYLQKAIAFDKKANEAARLRKAEEERVNRLKQNPWEILKEAGLDPLEEASKYVIEQHEEATLTPEQKELKKLRQEAEAARKYMEELRAQERAQKEAQKQAAMVDRYTKELDEILASSDIPQSAGMISIIVNKFQERQDALEDEEARDALSLKDVIDDAKKYYVDEVRAAVKHYAKDPKSLASFLGDDLMVAIRKADIAAIQEKQGSQAAQQVAAKPAATPKGFKSWDDFKKHYGVD